MPNPSAAAVVDEAAAGGRTASSAARLWLLTFVVVAVAGQAAVGMRAARTASVTGDEPFYLLTTQSLVSDGDLDLRDEYAGHEEREFWDGTVPLWKQMEPAPDGRLLSPHDPGLSLLLVPAYALGGLRGAQRFLVLVWAGALACAAVLARRAGAPPWAAVGAAVVVGAAPPGLVYASQVYPEGAAALCLALALLLATGRRARPWAVAAVVVALAWLGVKYVPLGAVVAAVWAWRFRRDPRALVTAGVVTGLAALHFGWWHLHTFGALTPYTTNVVWAGEGTSTILDSHIRLDDRSYRLHGLFLDARFGLLRWLPAAALALWGVGRRSVVHAALVAACVLIGTFVAITMMGWWFPGRMLVAGLPALAVLMALGATRLPKTAAVLGAWSLLIGAVLAYEARTGGVHLAIDPFDMGFPLAPSWLFPDFRHLTWRELLLSSVWIGALALLRWHTGRTPVGKKGGGGRSTSVGSGGVGRRRRASPAPRPATDGEPAPATHGER